MPDPDRTCPLLVVTRTWNDDDTADIVIAACGQPLYVRTEHYAYLDDDTADDGPLWRVQCGAGHVVVVPDDDTGEHPIPFDRRLVDAALDHTSSEAP